jgi:hypothetical protein
MKITKTKLSQLINESIDRSKHQRQREPSSDNVASVSLPEPTVDSGQLDFGPGGRRGFLLSMIDLYDKVGMRDAADKAREELSQMDAGEYGSTLKESYLINEVEDTDELYFQHLIHDILVKDMADKNASHGGAFRPEMEGERIVVYTDSGEPGSSGPEVAFIIDISLTK